VTIPIPGVPGPPTPYHQDPVPGTGPRIPTRTPPIGRRVVPGQPGNPLPDNTYAAYFSWVLAHLGIHGQQAIQDQYALADIVAVQTPTEQTHFAEINNPLDIAGGHVYRTPADSLTATVHEFQSHPGLLGLLQHGTQQAVVDWFNATTNGSNPYRVEGNEKESIVLASNIGTLSATPAPNPGGLTGWENGLKAEGQAVGSAIDSIGNVFGSIWGTLSSGSFWMRAGFIIVGVIVLAIAVDKASGGSRGVGGTSDIIVDQAANTGSAVKEGVTG